MAYDPTCADPPMSSMSSHLHGHPGDHGHEDGDGDLQDGHQLLEDRGPLREGQQGIVAVRGGHGAAHVGGAP